MIDLVPFHQLEMLHKTSELLEPIQKAREVIETGTSTQDQQPDAFFYGLGNSVAALVKWRIDAFDGYDPKLAVYVRSYYESHAFVYGGIDRLKPELKEGAITDLGKFVAAIFQNSDFEPNPKWVTYFKLLDGEVDDEILVDNKEGDEE